MRWLRRRGRESELDAELRFHIESLTAVYVRSGMPPEEARRRAILEFGHLEPAKEQLRDMLPRRRLHVFAADLRYGFRRLRATPGFTAVAVLSLALGIGANTALFSIVNAALLRLIPVHQPQELAWLAVDPPQFGRSLNYPFYEAIKDDAHFSGVLCAFSSPVAVSARGAPADRVDAELVSGNYFDTLGVLPHRGRLIQPADDRVRLGHTVAVLSHRYWQTRFGGDPAAVGSGIEINGFPYTVIGVAAPGFDGIEHGRRRSVFVPIQMKTQITPGWDGLDKPLIVWLSVMGRLKPGIDRDSLGHELNARFHAFQKPHLERDRRLTAAQRDVLGKRRIFLEPLRDAALSSRVRRHLAALSWLVGALLLLTCANLASLLLARGMERRREIATRLSLGASRGRVVMQLLTESSILGIAGGVAGLLLGALAAPILASRFPIDGPGSRFNVSLDASVAAFSFGLSLLATVLFGLTPALRATRLDLWPSLRGAPCGPRHHRLRHMLLAGQVAVALTLMVAAGLFVMNLRRLLSFDPGFASRGLLIAELDPMLNGYSSERRLALYRALEDRYRAEARNPSSAISAASLSNVAPLSAWHWDSLFVIEGREQEKDVPVRAVAVGQGYFEVLSIPLLQGRLLSERDDERAPRAAVISESLARRAFPDGTPIGRRFMSDSRDRKASTFEIVGVVRDTDLNDPRRRDRRECVYLPYRQIPNVPQAIVIQARVTGSHIAARETIVRAVRDYDPQLALYDFRTSEDALDTMLATERLVAAVTQFFAALAALLVGIGLYGLLAREVAARTGEIGIRLALGAPRRSVVWSMAGGSLPYVAAGLGVGVLFVSTTADALAPLLLDVKPRDPAILLTCLLFIAATALAAAWLPCRRAVRTDPAAALRHD